MRYPVIFITIFLLLVLSGCSDRSTSPGSPDSGEILTQDIPLEVQKLMESYIPAEDGAPPQAEVAYLDPVPEELIANCDVYAVTFLWGDLFNSGSVNTDTTDWTGTLSVNGEAVVHVRYMIDFEPGQDSVLAHNNPTFAYWISYTCNDFDGLSFLVFLKRDVVYVTQPVLTFETAPITLQFTFPQLVKLDAFYQVDNINGVAVHSRKIWQNTCPRGEFEGRWIKDSYDPNQGYFLGHWQNRWGTPIGYMNGTFWMNSDGIQEFAGSVSGLDTDEVILEFSGIWWFHDPRLCPVCGDDHGYFVGRYSYINGGNGMMKGEFGYPPSPADTNLPYHGVWHDNCLYADPTNVHPVTE
jgi:hypothetical protein